MSQSEVPVTYICVVITSSVLMGTEGDSDGCCGLLEL